MQVLLRPLTRQPLTEEEFYELGVETPYARFASRLGKLLKRTNEDKAQETGSRSLICSLADRGNFRFSWQIKSNS